MTNQDQNSSIKLYDLEDRTARFGEEIIIFVKGMQSNVVNNVLIRQIVRSGTSIGANYMEADGAESSRDFRHKIALCKKEAKETKHWLRMICKPSPEISSDCDKLAQEAHELALIFSAIIRSSISNES
ncbi:MAG: four helix bundle protein [Candidatus Uhrbacteria bacterium]|nr:four helix bundle protein [Candidatus Uhrbacteria bacterium]